jgi:DNA-directed RNA polymerase specialized sigma24 family protein
MSDAANTNGSVTEWIDRLKSGDRQAAAPLWNRFFRRLCGLIDHKLSGGARRVADEEDIVVSVFETVFRRAEEGRFPQLQDRHDLWQLLVKIADRKRINQMRLLSRQKRGGGHVRGESVFERQSSDGLPAGIDGLADDEPTPDFAAEVAEALRRLLDQLGDDELRTIARRKLEGCTNEEIAAATGRSLPTIERRLRLIRDTWEEGGYEQRAAKQR